MARRSPLLLLALLLALLGSACSSPSGVERFTLIPDPAVPPSAPPGLAVSAEPLSHAETATRLAELGWQVPPGDAELPVVGFMLHLANGTGKTVTVNPRMALLMDGLGTQTFTCDYSCLFRLFRSPAGARPELGSMIGQVGAGSVDAPITLEPGKKESRLLLLVKPERAGKQAVLGLTGIYLGTDPEQALLPFTVVPVKEGK